MLDPSNGSAILGQVGKASSMLAVGTAAGPGVAGDGLEPRRTSRLDWEATALVLQSDAMGGHLGKVRVEFKSQITLRKVGESWCHKAGPSGLGCCPVAQSTSPTFSPASCRIVVTRGTRPHVPLQATNGFGGATKIFVSRKNRFLSNCYHGAPKSHDGDDMDREATCAVVFSVLCA
ncbi:hypothetical protein VTK56DRAFT_9631 [Thermocarpiscus australiensis]